MTQEQVYKAWAPEECKWSPWVSPVLFSQIYCTGKEAAQPAAAPRWASRLDDSTAVVIDLRGDEGVHLGLALVPLGLWPIPAYNASPGPEAMGMSQMALTSELRKLSCVSMRGIVNAICGGTIWLSQQPIGAKMRPAFLLDSLRHTGAPEPGVFDNRWITIPQDYPSAEFLKREGISKVLLVQHGTWQPLEDLSHVLLRWQEKEIEILVKDIDSDDEAKTIRVRKPLGFKTSWYRVSARMGLRRSSAGGFGSVVPERSGAG